MLKELYFYARNININIEYDCDIKLINNYWTLEVSIFIEELKI